MKRFDRNMTIIRKAVEATYAKKYWKKAIAEIVAQISKTRLARGNELHLRLYIETNGLIWFEITEFSSYPVVWRSLDSEFLPVGFEEG